VGASTSHSLRAYGPPRPGTGRAPPLTCSCVCLLQEEQVALRRPTPSPALHLDDSAAAHQMKRLWFWLCCIYRVQGAPYCLCSFVCRLLEGDVSFCVILVLLLCCLIVVPLPPDKNPFAVQLKNYYYYYYYYYY
jgi:hypothetical protein